MGQNVEQLAKRITHIETSDAPGLVHGTILDLDALISAAPEHVVEVIHLNRKIRDRGARPAFRRHAYLRQGRCFRESVTRCHEFIHQQYVQQSNRLLTTMHAKFQRFI